MDECVVYTVGHSNQPAESLLALLTAAGIELLVDVRSSPFSRYNPQFNRERLAASLGEAGIDYHFLGDSLGGRPGDQSCYRAGTVDYGRVAKKDWYQAGIEALVALVGQRRPAIMCAEENPGKCHRSLLITPTLIARGLKVLHLRRGGRIEEAQLQLGL